MKKMCKFFAAVSAFALLSGTLYSSGVFTAFAESFSQTNRTISISSAEEFLSFAKECSLNSSSEGLCVELNADIDLGGKDFFGVPIFCGTFNGNGHKITGLSIRQSASECGLFRYTERGAVIKDLYVLGSVCPSGSENSVGGIVGVNRGTIISCEFSGRVSGNDSVGGIVGTNDESGLCTSCVSSAVISAESAAGGIAGTNLGALVGCENSGNINAVYSDTEIDAGELEIEDLNGVENVIGKTDIGGVAGYSSGTISRCKNTGTVGYKHTGYNIGGIVGRQCGTLCGCENTGEVYGRKDVGGIAGQMEPYKSIEFSEDTVSRLEDETDRLEKCADKLFSDAKNSGDRLNSELQTLTSQLSSAQKNLDSVTSRAEDIFDGYSSGINELIARADIALDKVPDALGAFLRATELIGDFTEKCADALDKIEQSGEYAGDAINSAKAALKETSDALPALQEALTNAQSAVVQLQKSLGDPEATKASLENINGFINDAAEQIKTLSAAGNRLNSALKELSDWLEGPDWEKLKTSANALSGCLSEILSAFGSISGAIDRILSAVDTTEVYSAITDLNSASAALGRAAAELSKALGSGAAGADELENAVKELESAASALETASEHLSKASDPTEMKAGLDELQTAVKALQTALEKASSAAKDASDALAAISASSVPSDTLNTAYEQIGIINDAVSALSDDVKAINAELKTILDSIDASGADEAIKTLANSAGKIADFVGETTKAVKSLESAANSLENAVSSLSSASGEAKEAAEIITKASEELSEAIKILKSAADEISEKPEVKFPAADETFTAAADGLSEDMKAMISTLSRLGNTANAESKTLLDDIQAVGDCVERILEIFKDAYKDLLSSDSEGFSQDISEINAEQTDSENRPGKAVGCKNSGKTEGDVNVGGIAGSMAIEFDLDPEDDISQSGDRTMNFSYNVLNIIEACENTGEIAAKKNYCGGIVGRMDMGLVKDARASGTVSSSGGNYVGGIAGFSSAKIRGCAAKTSLSGLAYIGGIAGEGGIITDCYALSDITDYTEKIGALAGYVDFSKKNTEISDNYFVDRGVAGIDRISYSGAAEPIDYAKFAERLGAFADIVLEFKADGETLYKLTVPYGTSVSEKDIPEIPEKGGYYARWEDFDKSAVTFSRVINAQYIQLLSAIECDTKDENGLPLLLADGNFDENAKIAVETESSSVFAPENALLRVVKAENCAPEKLRFLKAGNGSQLMQYINGEWKSIEFVENGSYLVAENVSLDNGTGTFCVVENTFDPTFIVIIAAAAAAAGVVLAIVCAVKSRKKKKLSSKG